MKRLHFIFTFWWMIAGPMAAFAATSVVKTPGDSVSTYLSSALNLVYNDFPKALIHLEKAESLAQISRDKNQLAEVSYSYGFAFYVKGEYGESLQYFLKAYKLFREQGNERGVAKGLVGQGLIQQGIDRHSEAVHLFRQAIKAFKNSGDYAASNPAYLNIAISEIELKKYAAARNSLELAIQLSQQAGRKDVEHMAYNKLGEISYLVDDPEKAISYHNRVLFDKAEPNGWEKSFAHAGLAQSFHKQGDLSLALEHGLLAMEFAKKAHSLWDLERNSRILANLYEEMDSTGLALDYLKMSQEFKDSIYNQAKLREINLLQLESKEAENQRLLVEKEIAEKRLFVNRAVTFLLILVTLFLIILLMLFYKKRKQKEIFHREREEKNRTIMEQNQLIMERNKELDGINKSKDKFFSILSHDLKSPIGSIQQLLEMMKSGDFTQEEQSELLDEMLKQISGTSFMLHNLLYWASSQLENSRSRPEKLSLPTEVEKVLRAYYWPSKQKNIHISHEVVTGLSNILVDKSQLAVILQNLISNAIKFSLEGRKITISYEDGEEQLRLIVCDGGEGISKEKIEEIEGLNTRMLSQLGTGMETGTGLGLLLVKEFVRANHAILEIRSRPGEGSQFMVSFPKAK